jgi:D-methionine transport system substrate-binding protein
VKLGIKPVLEKQGYKVKVVEFNDYIQPNFALAEGSLDANAFQHIIYLTKFSTENKLPLSELIKVPTAPIAIYSKKHTSLNQLKKARPSPYQMIRPIRPEHWCCSTN